MLVVFVFFITTDVGLQMKWNFYGMLLMWCLICDKNFMVIGCCISELLVYLALTW